MVLDSFISLKSYCEKENFAGWDPYDGLNSKVFQVTPFKHWKITRLLWIQLFKRSPINLRKLFLVSKGHNSKCIALALTSFCNLYKIAAKGNNPFGTKEQCIEKIDFLANLLLELQNKKYSGSCWGYNFDWQSKAFFLPKNTPTIVATSFAVEALLEAYEITQNKDYLCTAISSYKFIVHDLNIIQKQDGLFMFSYSPIDNQAVYNATLLASKTLSLIYFYSGKIELKELAYKSVKAVCDLQNHDGSFPHSDQVGQKWRDSFHTGFKLESLAYYQLFCKDMSFNSYINKGFEYWVNNFFDSVSGYSYYYDRGQKSNLTDLHCVAQSLSTFHKLNRFEKHKILIEKITSWAIDNMQNKEGYFYFQKNKDKINKIQYMRWPNVWMLYGLSFYFLNTINDDIS